MDSVYGQLRLLKKNGSNPIFQLEEGSCTIGCSLGASIRILAKSNVEDIHCVIDVKKDGLAILNNKAADEPVKVNGKDVLLKKFLKPGDIISIAGKSFQYENDNIPTNLLENIDKLKSTLKYPKTRMSVQVTRRFSRTPEPKSRSPLKMKCKRSNSLSSANKHFENPVESPFKTPGRRNSIRVRMANASFNKGDLSVSQLLPSKVLSTPQAQHGFKIATPSSSTRPTLRNEISEDFMEKETIPEFMKESIIDSSDEETHRDLKTPVTEETNKDFNTPINNTSIVTIEDPIEDNTPVRSRKSIAKNMTIQRLTQNDELVMQTPNLKTPKSDSKILKTPKSSLRKKRMTELMEYAICSTPAVAKEDDTESVMFIDDSMVKTTSKDIKKSVRITRQTPKSNIKVFPKTPKSNLKCQTLFNEKTPKNHSLEFIEESFNENIAPDTLSSDTGLDTPSGKVGPTTKESFVTTAELDMDSPLNDLHINKRRTTQTPDKKKKKLDDEYDTDSFNLFTELSPFKSDDYLEETDKEFSMNDNLCLSNVLVESPFVNIPKPKAVTEPKKKLKVAKRRSLQDNVYSNHENIENMNDSVQSIDTSSFIYMSSNDIKNDCLNKSLNICISRTEVDDTFVSKSRMRVVKEIEALNDFGSPTDSENTPEVQNESNDLSSPTGSGNKLTVSLNNGNDLNISSSRRQSMFKTPQKTNFIKDSENFTEKSIVNNTPQDIEDIEDTSTVSSRRNSKMLSQKQNEIMDDSNGAIEENLEVKSSKRQSRLIKTPKGQKGIASEIMTSKRKSKSLKASQTQIETSLLNVEEIVSHAEGSQSTPIAQKEMSILNDADEIISSRRKSKVLQTPKGEKEINVVNEDKKILGSRKKSNLNQTPVPQRENDLNSSKRQSNLMETPKIHLDGKVRQVNSSTTYLVHSRRKSSLQVIMSPKSEKKALNTPKAQKAIVENISFTRRKTRVKSIVQNIEMQHENDSIESKTPKQSRKRKIQKEPENDLTSPRGLKQLMKTPKVYKEPENDLSSPRGVKQLMKTPKVQRKPKNDLRSPRGVKQIMRTPKVYKEPKNDLRSPRGVKQLMKTPKPQKEPENDLRSPRGVKQLMKTPKPQRQPENDLRSPRGIKQLMRTPKPQREPLNDLCSPRGVKQLLKTPKIQNPPKNDLRSPRGVKQLMKTPKLQKEPLNDLTSPRGVKQIMRTPKVQKDPENDLSSPRGVKQLMSTPKEHKDPENNLSDFEGLSDLFQLTERSKVNSDLNLSGIEPLEEECIFPNRQPVKTYKNESSPSKNKLHESNSISPTKDPQNDMNKDIRNANRESIVSSKKFKTDEQNEINVRSTRKAHREVSEINELENQSSNKKNKKEKIIVKEKESTAIKTRTRRAKVIEVDLSAEEGEEKQKEIQSTNEKTRSKRNIKITSINNEGLEESEESTNKTTRTRNRRNLKTDEKLQENEKSGQIEKSTFPNSSITNSKDKDIRNESEKDDVAPKTRSRRNVKNVNYDDRHLVEWAEEKDNPVEIEESTKSTTKNKKYAKPIKKSNSVEDIVEKDNSLKIEEPVKSKTRNKKNVKPVKDSSTDIETIISPTKTRSRRNVTKRDHDSSNLEASPTKKKSDKCEEIDNEVDNNNIGVSRTRSNRTLKGSKKIIENEEAVKVTRTTRRKVVENAESIPTNIESNPAEEHSSKGKRKKELDIIDEDKNVPNTPVNKRVRQARKPNKKQVNFEEEQEEVKKTKRVQRKRASSTEDKTEIKNKKAKDSVEEAPVIRKSARTRK